MSAVVSSFKRSVVMPVLTVGVAWGSAMTIHARPTAAEGIFVNQVGYPTHGQKLVAVSAPCGKEYQLTDVDGNVVYEGQLSVSAMWPPSKTSVCTADLTAFRHAGTFFLRAGAASDAAVQAPPIQIGEDPYEDLHVAALRAFYLTRSGMELESRHAGVYSRSAGHPDTSVLVHESAQGPERKAGDVLSAAGGWYDAGDYNKYVVNSAITTYTLLAAYDRNPSYYRELNLSIPESKNATPDILDEAAWNIRWMLSMMDPADGGVYHKLTTKRFSPMVMPNDPAAQKPRYVVAKSTAASLGLAAVAAMASRIYEPFQEDYPDLSRQARETALAAYQWAKENPGALYRQPSDVQTGAYAPANEDLEDEFAWTGVELFLITRETDYLDAIRSAADRGGVPSWDWVQPLAWMTIARHHQRFPADVQEDMRAAIEEVAEILVSEATGSAFRVPTNAFPKGFVSGRQERSFVWGSNGHVANQAIVLLTAFDITGHKPYINAAFSALDYLLGRNPLGRSFVSGFGTHPPRNLHHRLSVADSVEEPIPGMLAGGPNQDRQDVENCAKDSVTYESMEPALSYLDEVCSYASNEMAINWNAALVYVAGALSGLR